VLTLRDAYKDYKQQSKNKGLYDQPEIVYTSVNKRFNELLMENHIMRESNKFKFILGHFRIAKKKVNLNNLNQLHVDWQTSRKLGKRVYHLNQNTKGYRFFFKWEKTGSIPCRNISYYQFIPTRAHKRYLAELLKNPQVSVDYFQA
jgi:hypothetical protein